MKGIYLSCFFMLLVSFTVNAQTPVAYYPFTGNANDAIGSLNGTLNGGVQLTTDRFGNPNSAYNFDGIDDAISFNALPMTNIDNFSLLAWVNPALFSSSNQFNKMIVSLGPGSNGYNMGMGNNSGSGSGNELGGLYNLVTWLHSGSFFSSVNTWYHVAMIRENGVTKFYMNAVLAPNTNSNTPFTPTTAFQIGGQDFDPTHYWNGKIDEVKIYNVALTAAQIQQEYASSSQLQKPGSGNAISFNGSAQSINIPNAASINFGTNDFSLGFWYNSINNGRAELVFEKRDDNCGDGQNWSIRKAADQIYLEVNVPGPTSDVVVIPAGGDGKWHHIVFTRTATQLSGFKDGILIATTNAPAQNVNNSAPVQIGTGPCSPFFPGGNGFFTGSLDEIQFWNTALTQAQIRDRMCKKITSGDPSYSNLMAYYNFDESTGATIFDGTINANNGTLVNSPSRTVSGAHIGNTSTHSYAGSASTTVLTHPTRSDALTATLSSGGADGIQVYCVTEDPNNTTGQTILTGNNSYFGVFPINGTATQYTATYNYSGIALNANPENKLILYKRNDNAASSWNKLAGILDSTANTFTATGQNTEYMIGLNDQQQVLKPGSGNAISFDGTDDFIGAASQQLIAVNSFTMEAWVKPDKAITVHSQSTSGTAGTGGVNSYLFFPTHGSNDIPVVNSVGAGISVGTNGVCVMEHTGGYLPVLLTWSGTISGWAHIAVVYTNKQPSLYVNGVLVATGLTSTANNIYASNLNSGYPGAYGMYSGLADEIRIWDVSLTPSQIKDRMCKKVTSSDALFADLVIYSNFDESSGTVAFDGTVNQLNYNLINGTTRLTSGAAIGNASAHDYVNPIKTASIAHASAESFTVTSTSGNPDGIHVYRVDEQPNTLTGTLGVGDNNKYFGVFQVGGTTPQYTAVYSYNGNPLVNATNENTLALFKRNDNATTAWNNGNAALNITAKTLTLTGQSTEYILGSSGAALPLNLISFSGQLQNTAVHLQWKTSNEINTASFEVECANGSTAFKSVGTVLSVNLSNGSDYNFVHVNTFAKEVVQYYRLKIIDKDGSFKYSNIIRISNPVNKQFTVFPSPAQAVITISSSKNQQAVIINTAGQILNKIDLVKGSQLIDVTALAAGVYFIKAGEEVVKFIKQ
jgi:Concanavalin A-like lectin/glucanases superfamily/Secretion system C-terminal sorting domain